MATLPREREDLQALWHVDRDKLVSVALWTCSGGFLGLIRSRFVGVDLRISTKAANVDRD